MASIIVPTARMVGRTKLYVSDESTWDAAVTGVTLQIYLPGSSAPNLTVSSLALNFIGRLSTYDELGGTGEIFPDGIYQIFLIEEGDDLETNTLFYLNIGTLDYYLLRKIEEMSTLSCGCKKDLCEKICRWMILRWGIIQRFRANNMSKINTDIANLTELVQEEFMCDC